MRTEEEVRARIAALEDEKKKAAPGSWTANRNRVRVDELKYALGEDKKEKAKKE